LRRKQEKKNMLEIDGEEKEKRRGGGSFRVKNKGWIGEE
jgi:hypothetical protein